MNSNQNVSQAYLVWIIAVLFYCYQFILRVSPGVMIQDLMQSFHIDATTVGIIAAFYLNTYSLLQIPAGIMIDRFGVKRMMITSIVILIVGCFTFSHAHALTTLYLGRLLIGAGSATAFISCSCVVRQWFKPHQLNLMLSLTMTLSTIGALNGGMPLAWLIDHVGWRESLNYISFIGLGLIILVVLFVKDKLQPQKVSQKNSEKNATHFYLWQIIKMPQLWLIAIAAFGMYLPLSVFADLWGISFVMKVTQASRIDAAGATSMVYVGLCCGAPCAAWFVSKIQSRKQTLLYNAYLILITLIALLSIPDLNITQVSILAFILGFGIGSEVLCFAMACEVVDPKITGLTVGFVNSITMAGGAFFQSAVGQLLDYYWDGTYINNIRHYSVHNYRMALILLLGCIVLSIICLFYINDDRQKPSEYFDR